MMTPVSLYRLLGPLTVERDGRPLDLGPPKQRTVLAMLAHERGVVVSTDRLLDAVWGEQHPAQARAGLQVYVSHLRRILRGEPGAPSPVVRRGRGYVLEAADDVFDVDTFIADSRAVREAVDAHDWATAVDSARRALGGWRGPYLADLADEDWVRTAAHHLHERRLGVAQDLVVGLLGAGDLAAAVAESAELRSANPLVERIAWLAAVALHRAGRTGEALTVVQEFRGALADELGLDAGPALRDLQTAMLRHDPTVATWPGPHAVGSPVPAPEPVTVPGVVEPEPPTASAHAESTVSAVDRAADLVGRGDQLERLDGALHRSRTDGTRWVVLSGRAGIGKTRLAQELARRWSGAGGLVIKAACPDDDSLPPWWTARQLIVALGNDPADVLAAPGSADADAVRFDVLERTRDVVLRSLDTGPTLLFLDDVQWSDRPSLHWLTFLAGTVDRPGLAVVLTVRSGSRRVELDQLLATVARGPGNVEVVLPPLTGEQVGELVARVSGETMPAQEAAELAARIDGNPFFAREFARLDPAERRRGTTPATVRSVVRRRLAALPADTADVVTVAAVLGDPLDVELVAAVTGRDRDEVGDALDRAADEEVLAPAVGSPTYTFAHALLRDEVVAALPTLGRQRLHLRVARAIGPDATGAAQVRRAVHLRAAGGAADPTEAYLAARAVAENADRDWHPDLAATWWDAAFHAEQRLPDRDPARHHELVRARVAAMTWAGRGQTVLEVLDAALLEALREGRTQAVGVLAASLVRVSGSWPWPVYGADPAPLLATLRAVGDRLDSDAGARARVLAAGSIGHCYDPDPGVPDRMSATAIELAEATGDPEVLADALLGRAMVYAGVATHTDESLALLRRAAGLEHELADVDEVLVRNIATMAHFARGDMAAFARDVEAGAVGADLMRLQLSRVQFRWAEGALAQWRGEFGLAERLYTRAEVSHRQTQLQQSGTFELAGLILRWERGQLAGADGTVLTNPAVSAWTSAVVAAAADRPDADALLTAEVHRAEPTVWTSHGRLALLAHAVADRGARPLAGPLLTALAPFGGQLANLGQIGAVGPVDLARGRLAALVGDRDGAREQLRRALALARDAAGAPSVLRTRVAQVQLDLDDPTVARPVPDDLAALRDEAAARGMVGLVGDLDRLAADAHA